MFAFTKLMQAMVASGTASDPQFYLTTLLLNTSSTNGAQNNTFLDSSTNNFTITRNGNTTQGTFTPFSQTGWSNFLDGSSHLSSTTAGVGGSGDFTVEAWVFPTITSSIDNPIYDTRGGTGWNLFIPSGLLTLNSYDTTAGVLLGASTNSLTLNAWNHVAFVKSGSNNTYYINGVSSGTYTRASTATPSAIKIGSDTGSGKFRGYISNFRTVTSAVYTSAFTPSTTPLTAISGTTLLTCQSNRFIDNSASPITLTANGTPSVQAFSPFAPTAAYDAAVVGGSGYFDGSGDYLSLSSTSLNLSSSDFTIETWVYATTTARDFVIGSLRNADGAGSWQIMFNDAQPIRFYCRYNGGTSLDYQVGSGTFPINQWVHLAITRSGANLRVFQNGTQVGTTNTTLSTFSIDNATTNYYVASSTDPSEFYTGYLSGTRLLVGTALYTTTFTPPTAPPTAITNTTLLLNYTNAGIFDSAAKNVLETVADAQVSTTQAKWGTTSMSFDGTGDWLLIPNNQMLNLNADFTIEFWIYLNSTSGEQCIFHNYNSDNNGVFVSVNGGGAGKIRLGAGNGSSFYVLIDSSTAISASTWAYVACTRSGSTWTVYINGSSAGTATSSSNPTFSTSDLIQIGRFTSGTPNALNAYIDDLRITKYARTITASPAAAFPIQ